jgi:hypothetical protein
MTEHTLVRFASLIIITLTFTALAHAAPQRTFVSAQHGDDANTVNNCSITLPCRNFNAAIGVVNAGAITWWTAMGPRLSARSLSSWRNSTDRTSLRD